MKKIICGLLLIIIVLNMVACGDSNFSQTENSESEPTITVEPSVGLADDPTVEPSAEPVSEDEYDGYSITDFDPDSCEFCKVIVDTMNESYLTSVTNEDDDFWIISKLMSKYKYNNGNPVSPTGFKPEHDLCARVYKSYSLTYPNMYPDD